MQLNPKEIKVKGLTESKIALALVMAGGSDAARPSSELCQKAFDKIGSKSIGIMQLDSHWVALKGKKPGITFYRFLFPVKLV